LPAFSRATNRHRKFPNFNASDNSHADRLKNHLFSYRQAQQSNQFRKIQIAARSNFAERSLLLIPFQLASAGSLISFSSSIGEFLHTQTSEYLNL
jgi:hypothetical protein